ncbi:MAG: agmatine deiminase family protein, partial [Firmicutes bacterium]|nr:agmatine deiminase family protein [Bacillota bacterium]
MMKKVRILLVLLLVISLAAGCSSQQPDEGAAETSVEFVFPGEWEEHEGTWIIWPHNYGVIEPEYVDMIDEIWVTMTEALHEGENVHIVAYDEDEKVRICGLLEEVGTDLDKVDFVIEESDQFWARDCGPLFVSDKDGKPAVLDFGYNGYGRMDKMGPDVPEELRWEMPEFVREEYMENYVKDDLLAASAAEAIGLESIDLNEFVLEGGAFEADGCGTIITTESCILNENRNPGMTR